MCIIFGKCTYIIYINTTKRVISIRDSGIIIKVLRDTIVTLLRQHNFYKLEKYSLWQCSISIIVAIINYKHIRVGGQFEEQCVYITYNDIFWFDVYLIRAGVLCRKDDNPMYLYRYIIFFHIYYNYFLIYKILITSTYSQCTFKNPWPIGNFVPVDFLKAQFMKSSISRYLLYLFFMFSPGKPSAVDVWSNFMKRRVTMIKNSINNNCL